MTITVSQTTIPVIGADPFPVRRIYCVGRNYRAHAIEMGFDPDREPPFFFMKPADAIVPTGSTIAYPPRSENFHFEIELVVAIGKAAQNISVEDAASVIYGYATGLDMTRRDVQMAAREKGRPWDMGKGFDESAPCAPISRIEDTGEITGGAISLTVNGEPRQDSDLKALIWNVNEVIAELSTYNTLEPGDLIFTGTPEGVGPVVAGDRMLGKVEGLADLEITVGPAANG
ncbi:MAG: fumarylacetoacetate hydrolase family protein [Henriciella sp.]|nr:fumarylacetoacetate hydrolase family protein [Henriciella sp.]